MTTFAIPAPANTELAGPMNDLAGELIALKPLGGEITVNTSYGPQTAVRVQVVEPLSGTNLGVRLLFWSQMRRQVLENASKDIDYSVGIIREDVQVNNPDRTLFTLTAPDDDTDWGRVQAGLNAFALAELKTTQPTASHSDDAPF